MSGNTVTWHFYDWGKVWYCPDESWSPRRLVDDIVAPINIRTNIDYMDRKGWSMSFGEYYQKLEHLNERRVNLTKFKDDIRQNCPIDRLLLAVLESANEKIPSLGSAMNWETLQDMLPSVDDLTTQLCSGDTPTFKYNLLVKQLKLRATLDALASTYDFYSTHWLPNLTKLHHASTAVSMVPHPADAEFHARSFTDAVEEITTWPYAVLGVNGIRLLHQAADAAISEYDSEVDRLSLQECAATVQRCISDLEERCRNIDRLMPEFRKSSSAGKKLRIHKVHQRLINVALHSGRKREDCAGEIRALARVLAGILTRAWLRDALLMLNVISKLVEAAPGK